LAVPTASPQTNDTGYNLAVLRLFKACFILADQKKVDPVLFCEIANLEPNGARLWKSEPAGICLNRHSFELPSVCIELEDRASFIYAAKLAVDGGRTAIW